MEQQTTSPNKEHVPIEQARFLDPIEPAYEELWRKLHGAAKATFTRCEEVLLPIFADDTLPQAIRDRAGMVALGVWSPSYPYEREGWTRSFGYLFGGISTDTFQELAPDFTMHDLTAWIYDIAKYEETTKQMIVHPATALSWVKNFNKNTEPDPAALQMITYWTKSAVYAPPDIRDEKKRENYLVNLFNLCCELYNDSYIDEETFDGILSTLPTTSLRLNLEHEEQDDGGWLGGNGTAPVKHPGSFTIISEGLSSRSAFDDNSRFTKWCKKKLHDWTIAQRNSSVILPDWLRAVDEPTGKSFYTGLARVMGTRNAKEKDWSIIKEGIQVFGEDILLTDTYDGRMLTIASEANDPQIQYAIVRGVLLKRAQERIDDPEKQRAIYFKESLALVTESAHKIGDEHLIALASIEAQLFTADKEAKALRDEKQRQEERIKEQQDPMYIQKQQALADLSATIENLRTLYAESH